MGYFGEKRWPIAIRGCQFCRRPFYTCFGYPKQIGESSNRGITPTCFEIQVVDQRRPDPA